MTDDKAETLKLYQKVMAVATCVVNGQMGVIEGSRALTWLSHTVDKRKRANFSLFIGIDSDADNLAIGPERVYWATDQLVRQDAEIADFEAFYRQAVMDGCLDLIRRIETEINELNAAGRSE
jgi:hypothetical protein